MSVAVFGVGFVSRPLGGSLIPAAPAWYVAGTSVVTAIATMALPESRDRALKD